MAISWWSTSGMGERGWLAVLVGPCRGARNTLKTASPYGPHIIIHHLFKLFYYSTQSPESSISIFHLREQPSHALLSPRTTTTSRAMVKTLSLPEWRSPKANDVIHRGDRTCRLGLPFWFRLERVSSEVSYYVSTGPGRPAATNRLATKLSHLHQNHHPPLAPPEQACLACSPPPSSDKNRCRTRLCSYRNR